MYIHAIFFVQPTCKEYLLIGGFYFFSVVMLSKKNKHMPCSELSGKNKIGQTGEHTSSCCGPWLWGDIQCIIDYP